MKQLDTTQEDFDRLLRWLDDDRDEAGRKYETIRYRLIKMLTCRSCQEAEDVADEAIRRVTVKLPEIAPSYEGDPALYFYGVARNVHREYLRKQHRPAPPVPVDVTDEDDHLYECLDRCMQTIPENSRELVLRYYDNEEKGRIDDRKALADELGIAINALRIKAHRIRLLLRKCVKSCMEEIPAN